MRFTSSTAAGAFTADTPAHNDCLSPIGNVAEMTFPSTGRAWSGCCSEALVARFEGTAWTSRRS
jgi:hypothetical protein